MNTILIIEDEPLITYALVMILAREGYKADTTWNQETALSLLDFRNYRAVVTDLGLQGENDQRTWLRKLRALHRGSLIVHTGGSNFSGLKDWCRESGAHLLYKPCNPEDLLPLLLLSPPIPPVIPGA